MTMRWFEDTVGLTLTDELLPFFFRDREKDERLRIVHVRQSLRLRAGIEGSRLFVPVFAGFLVKGNIDHTIK